MRLATSVARQKALLRLSTWFPVSRIAQGVVSATRLACKGCNRSKGAKPLAVFLLERLRSLPLKGTGPLGSVPFLRWET
jgi:hypothetical protein